VVASYPTSAGTPIRNLYYSADGQVIVSGGLALRRAAAGIGKEIAGRTARPRGNCFVAGTPIRMAFGSRPIEQIQPGDLVLSRDENGPEAPLTTARVVQTFARHANLVALTVGARTIRTTAEHPFWVRGRGWTDVKDLVVGDRLLGHEGRWTVLSAIEDEQELATVYNFEVEELHLHWWGLLGILRLGP
jgi:hypothetical protein